MGIINAATIIEQFAGKQRRDNNEIYERPKSLYNAAPRLYNIVFDGEMMRYKGYVDTAVNCESPEFTIAAIAKNCTHSTVEEIKNVMSKEPYEVIVYMDGQRVPNKVKRLDPNPNLNKTLIRHNYIEMCRQLDYKVVLLERGEAELHMYIQRDKSIDLNIFVTGDSDMISICYGHRPKINGVLQTDCGDMVRTGVVVNNQLSNFQGTNITYDNSLHVQDSCAWLRINDSAHMNQFYGMDSLHEIFKFNVRHFRIFVAMCGTDFTPSALTRSMIGSVLSCTIHEKESINAIEENYKIFGAFLYLGLKYCRACIKRVVVNNTANSNKGGGGGTVFFVDGDSEETARRIKTFIDQYLTMYTTYIEMATTGSIEKFPDMGTLVRYFIYAMRGGPNNTKIYKGNLTMELKKWSNQITLSTALRNLEKYLGTVPPEEKTQTIVQTIRANKKNKNRIKKKPAIDADDDDDDIDFDDITALLQNDDDDNDMKNCSVDVPNFSFKLLPTSSSGFQLT